MKVETYKTRTNTDIVNPMLNFYSEVEGIKEYKLNNGAAIKPADYHLKPNTKEYDINVINNCYLQSKYFFNGEEIKLFSAIQQLVETKKVQDQVDKVLTDNEIQIKCLIENKITHKEQAHAFTLEFTINDIAGILNMTAETQKKSLKKRIKDLQRKLMELELFIDYEKNDKTYMMKTELYKLETLKTTGRTPTTYKIFTSPLDFFNIKESLKDFESYEERLIEVSKQQTSQQFIEKEINPFEGLSKLEIGIYNYLTYRFMIDKRLKNVEINLDDLMFQMYKHEPDLKTLVELQGDEITAKRFNLNLKTIKYRRQTVKSALNNLIKKEKGRCLITIKKDLIEIDRK
jgi:hypothetical protein